MDVRTLPGHGRRHKSWRGKDAGNWKGGRIKSEGYWRIYKPEHQFANKKGYVLEHRLVFEEYHKCILLPWVVIHHKNGNRDDNRITNLERMARGQHTIHHKLGKKRLKWSKEQRKSLSDKMKEIFR